MKQRFSTKKSTNKVNEHLRNDRSLPVMYEFQASILHLLIIFYSSLVLFSKGRYKSVIEVPQCDTPVTRQVGYIEAYRCVTLSLLPCLLVLLSSGQDGYATLKRWT